jgi:hypothetical protein
VTPRPAEANEEQRQAALGVGSVVRLRQTVQRNPEYPAGTLGLVVRQNPTGGYRYEVMVPGDPMTFFQPGHALEVVPVSELFGAEAEARGRAQGRAEVAVKVEGLAARWDQHHEDWCCQKGCVHIDRMHPGNVEFATDGGIQQIGPDYPCPGECTCLVGPFRDEARALLADTEGA